MSKEIARRGGSDIAGRETPVRQTSPQCAAHGCFLANVDVREKMRQAVAGQLGRNYAQAASAAYSLCRSIKEGDCACAGRGSMPCAGMVSAVEFMCSVLVPAVLAANGITDAELRMRR